MSITVRRLARAAVASCIGIAMTAAALQGPATAAPPDPPTPAEDPFYTPPSPLPDGAPETSSAPAPRCSPWTRSATRRTRA
ncbi:hypothetical protein [Actinomadura madurae]|uniref:hypothetical protein n=1 Tax=Actinomadura madurae TaxID=1993 RepID=UPI0020D2484B|nr:hypothetical protein [Actinomadura madurae]MCP9966656.1 hypothetical protein [Actinomadura madurae]MCQ0009327.1 hypothetical protein [Actinomadura madurae]